MLVEKKFGSRSLKRRARYYTIALVHLCSWIVIHLFQPSDLRAQVSDEVLLKDINSLTEAEQRFANAAVVKNIKTAFKEVLSEESIVFRPHPMNGRYSYRIDSRSDTTYLFWKPELVSISRGGDFGYSTGPWYSKRSKRYGEITGFGNFVTVWQKDKKGTWKVLLDKGVNYSNLGERKVELKKIIPSVSMGSEKIEIDSIMSMDSKRFRGIEKDAFNEETLIFRHFQWPVSSAKFDLTELSNYTSWEPIGGHVAPLGDMAFTYGKYEVTRDEKKVDGYYLRIWKKKDNQSWNIVVDLRTDN